MGSVLGLLNLGTIPRPGSPFAPSWAAQRLPLDEPAVGDFPTSVPQGTSRAQRSMRTTTGREQSAVCSALALCSFDGVLPGLFCGRPLALQCETVCRVRLLHVVQLREHT